jgi:uncharacterized protein YaiI (UPF0178 family)
VILVDADACPVKEQVYAAAYRHKTAVRLYAASYLRHPDHPLISMVAAGDAFDAADDRIVEDAAPGTLVIAADLPLAGRAIEKGAAVLTHRGEVLDAANIGGKLATRDLMHDLRGGLEGQALGGPRAFSKADRSAFAQAIETALRKL